MVEKNDKKEKERPKEKADNDGAKEKQPMTMQKVIILMSASFLLILIITVVSLILVLRKSPVTADTTVEQKDDKKQVETKKEVNNNTPSNKSESKKDEAVAATNSDELGDAANGKKPAIFYSIKPVFVVNLNSERVKFLQIGVDVMTRSQIVVAKITDNLPIIKNELITLFSNKSYDEVKTLDGREALRREALKVIKEVLEKETGSSAGVEDVLFTGFVMQ